MFVSVCFRGEANGQFISRRCKACKGSKEKCPLASAIIHPFAIFIPSNTDDAPAENTISPHVPTSIVTYPPTYFTPTRMGSDSHDDPAESITYPHLPTSIVTSPPTYFTPTPMG